MRFTLPILCFSLIFSAPLAADPASPSLPAAFDTYIKARDQAIAEFKAHPSAGDSDRRQERALADLDRLLKQAMPAWSSPGFDAGKINLATLAEGDINFGEIDGLRYEGTGGVIVIATAKPLLVRWLADHRTWWKDEKNVPTVMTTAFRSEAFWTQAVSSDAAAYLHGLVLVKAPKGSDVAVVELVGFAQDLLMDRGPDMVLAAVMRGDRIFLAEEPLKEKLAPVPYCQEQMRRTLARAKAEKNADKSNAIEELADREYRWCFAQHLPEQANYKAVQKLAQALVDMLH